MVGFVYRLLPPRPTFAEDMTPDERATMSAHGAYWAALMDAGKAVAFGPVYDPAGSYGLGIVVVENRAEAEAIRDADPAITSPHGLRCELAPMIRLVTTAGVYDAG